MRAPYHYFGVWRRAGWLIVAAIVVFSLTPQQPHIGQFEMNDKVGHALVYAIAMGWFAALYPALKQRARYALFFIALGIALEFLQGLTPYREFELLDMLADAIGVVAGVWLGQPLLGPVDHGLARLLRRPG